MTVGETCEKKQLGMMMIKRWLIKSVKKDPLPPLFFKKCFIYNGKRSLFASILIDLKKKYKDVFKSACSLLHRHIRKEQQQERWKPVKAGATEYANKATAANPGIFKKVATITPNEIVAFGLQGRLVHQTCIKYKL